MIKLNKYLKENRDNVIYKQQRLDEIIGYLGIGFLIALILIEIVSTTKSIDWVFATLILIYSAVKVHLYRIEERLE